MAFTHLRAGEFMHAYFRQVPSIVAKGALLLPPALSRCAAGKCSAKRAASTLFCSASASTSRFNASLSSESIFSGSIPSLNHPLDKSSTPPTRVKPPHHR